MRKVVSEHPYYSKQRWVEWQANGDMFDNKITSPLIMVKSFDRQKRKTKGQQSKRAYQFQIDLWLKTGIRVDEFWGRVPFLEISEEDLPINSYWFHESERMEWVYAKEFSVWMPKSMATNLRRLKEMGNAYTKSHIVKMIENYVFKGEKSYAIINF